MRIKKTWTPIIFMLVSTLFACELKPEPIEFGNDHCDYCRMSIVDSKYGAELITDKGRVIKFDATECMILYKKEHLEITFSMVLAIAYDNPKELYPVDELGFIVNETYQSPMGRHLAAFKNLDNEKTGTKSMSWDELLNN